MNGGTTHVDIAFDLDGSVVAKRSGTELGRSSPGKFMVGLWYSLAIEVVIHDTTGRVTIYKDGEQVLNLTNQDTRNGATTTVTQLKLGSGAGGFSYQYDDIYIHDSATALTDHPRIEVLYPSGDGGTLTLTPSTGVNHYAVVDETQADTSDYLSGSAVGNLDLLDATNLSGSPTTIPHVGIVAVAAKTDATARSVALGVKSGATTSDGGNFALSTTIARYERGIDLDPNTAAAWTAAAVNALQFQPKVTV